MLDNSPKTIEGFNKKKRTMLDTKTAKILGFSGLYLCVLSMYFHIIMNGSKEFNKEEKILPQAL